MCEECDVCDEPEEEPESDRGGDGGRIAVDGSAALPVPSPRTLGAGGSLDIWARHTERVVGEDGSTLSSRRVTEREREDEVARSTSKDGRYNLPAANETRALSLHCHVLAFSLTLPSLTSSTGMATIEDLQWSSRASNNLTGRDSVPAASTFFTPSVPDLPSGQAVSLASGYLPARPPIAGTTEPQDDAHLYFVLERARHLASKRRLVIWFNGGPGCSS